MDQNAPEAAEPTPDYLNRSLFNASLDSSALSANCSPGGVNPRRRESKSRAEKRRRDRINACFQRMHQLLEDELKCNNTNSPSSRAPPTADSSVAGLNPGLMSPGAEKAEILEQMIKFVEHLKRERQPLGQCPDVSKTASTPERSRLGTNVDDNLIKSYISGYKKGIQNIFILIDRLCHESERLTKTELIEKIKKGYLDNFDSPAVEREKLAAAVATVTPTVCRPALGDLSNQRQAPGETPTPKKSSTATATAAAALIELSSSPICHQPPAKKRRAFREQHLQLQQQQQPPMASPLLRGPPQYEPISPGPYEPPSDVHGGGDAACVWRPW